MSATTTIQLPPPETVWAYEDHDRKRPVHVKLADAVEHYRVKWAREPQVVQVHPSLVAELRDAGERAGVIVEGHVNVAPNVFFVGQRVSP